MFIKYLCASIAYSIYNLWESYVDALGEAIDSPSPDWFYSFIDYYFMWFSTVISNERYASKVKLTSMAIWKRIQDCIDNFKTDVKK